MQTGREITCAGYRIGYEECEERTVNEMSWLDIFLGKLCGKNHTWGNCANDGSQFCQLCGKRREVGEP